MVYANLFFVFANSISLFNSLTFARTLTSSGLFLVIIKTSGKAILDEPKVVAVLSIKNQAVYKGR